MNSVRIIIEQLRDIARAALEMTPQIVVAALLLLATLLMSKLVQRALRHTLPRKRIRPSLRSLAINLGALVTWVVGIMLAAVIAFPGLTPTGVLAGLGLGSVAIGFAFKDIFENFLAGIIILFRREMRIGDYVECSGLEGAVESISIRECHLRQTDGQLVIVPNSLLFKNPLTIRTDLEQRRTTIICGVAYGEDVDNARDIIQGAVQACESVKASERPVEIFAQAFGASSVDFEVTWWTGSQPIDIRRSRDEVVAAVKRALDDADIEIPFPYRTLTFAEPLQIADPRGESDQNS